MQICGQRVKVSKEIAVGDCITIRQGWEEKEVTVRALSDKRAGAPIAQALYEESAASIKRREREAAIRKAAGSMARPLQRPDKHERRQLNRLRRQLDD